MSGYVYGNLSADVDDAALLEISTASDKKVQTILASTPTCSEAITGYRLIDIELISSVFSTLLCPSCGKMKLKLSELTSKKKGLASFLLLQCTKMQLFPRVLHITIER